MAEQQGTQTQPGQSQTAPGATDPNATQTASDATSTMVVVDAPSASPDPTAAELEQLRSQNERYKQQMHGWEQQSQRHRQETDQLKTQLEQTNQMLQAFARTGGQSSAATTPVTTARPKDLAEAMGRYLAGDDTALQGIPLQSQTRPDDVVPIVQQILGNYVGFLDRQNTVMQAFPELNDRANPLYREIYDAYDELAQNPLSTKLYREDPEMQVDFAAPDGSQNRRADLRIMKDAVLHVRARHAHAAGAQDETRRAGVGDAMSGNGRTTSGQQQQQVEAIRLLTDNEKKQIQELIRTKAWPKEWPKDERTAAKFFFDGLPEDQRQQRIAAYHGARTR